MKNIKVWKENGITKEEIIAEGTYDECVRAGERYIEKHPVFGYANTWEYRLEIIDNI